MHHTIYVLGKVEPVFTGDVTHIPGKGERVIVDETTHYVESICWTLKEGTLSAFVYLK